MPFTNQKSIRNSINVIKFFLNKKYTSEILHKIYSKFFDSKPKLTNKENLDQIEKNKISSKKFIQKINSELFETVNEETDNIIFEAKKIQEKNSNIELGNNYAVEIIYFLMINFKPNIILETGVAAGLSSRCILEAIKKNSKGVLYSSDFPYFRLSNPEKYIGIMVPEELKKNWHLEILGDEKNIKKFKLEINYADIILYDSDKRYSGKINFFKSVNSLIKSNTIIVVDDLHNDSFFLEYVEEKKCKNWFIVESKRNHIVGVILPNNIKIL
jgi:predicted O-methyltransferase YrrM